MKEVTLIKHGTQEIYSPNSKYVALLHDDKSGYIVCPVLLWEDGEHVDTDLVIGWISHTYKDTGFYLNDVTVENNFKIDLIELYSLVCLCCLGHADLKHILK